MLLRENPLRRCRWTDSEMAGFRFLYCETGKVWEDQDFHWVCQRRAGRAVYTSEKVFRQYID